MHAAYKRLKEEDKALDKISTMNAPVRELPHVDEMKLK